MSRARRAFTLVELLVVIGLIAVLASLLVPAISKIRQRAHEADTRQFMLQLQSAIENYQSQHRAYPGPLGDDEIHNPIAGQTIGAGGFQLAPAAGFDTTSQNAPRVRGRFTMSENLVLGLLGGLRVDVTNPANPILTYDPALVGNGPSSLNVANPKTFPALVDGTNLSWRTDSTAMNGKTGRFIDGAGFADDTIVPEFVDRFPDPLPFIYLRARRGVAPIPPATAIRNSVVSYDPASDTIGRVGVYDVRQFIAYTGAYEGDEANPMLVDPPTDDSRSIGVGKRAPTYVNITPRTNPFHGMRTVNIVGGVPRSINANDPNYVYPLDAYPYLQNPGSPNSARNKDTYVLISAGIDRIYGTRDDVVSFGTVGE